MVLRSDLLTPHSDMTSEYTSPAYLSSVCRSGSAHKPRYYGKELIDTNRFILRSVDSPLTMPCSLHSDSTPFLKSGIEESHIPRDRHFPCVSCFFLLLSSILSSHRFEGLLNSPAFMQPLSLMWLDRSEFYDELCLHVKMTKWWMVM